MGVEIRRADAADVAACVEILRAWIDETPWMPMLHSRASMQHFWGSKLRDETGWIAAEGDQVVGFCVRADETIIALYLAPQARDRGVGSALLAAARDGLAQVCLYTFQANTGARRFYERHGFVEIARSEDENEEHLPDIKLQWTRSIAMEPRP